MPPQPTLPAFALRPVEAAPPAPAAAARSPGRWLGTKLHAPAALTQQVARRAILEHVAAARDARLVLVRAPAGFGKTTAMLQCREQMQAAEVATGWLTLDAADNDAPRFLAALDAAVAALFGDAPLSAARPAPDDERGIGHLALDLIARLAAHDEPIALFLDDFEVLHEPGVLGLVRELIDNLPRRGRIVIGSRVVPDLRLGRLRARGQLVEIDTARLRFSLDETAAFFAARPGPALPRDIVESLHGKTEGWAAAVRLASIALERSEAPAAFVERFSGTDQSLTDYLADEVLSRQPPALRDFLLRTSVLKHLEPSLCSALVPGVDSARILHELEAADVLLVPLDDAPRSYRYHSLFARFLQQQLERESPGAARPLHAAACAWYAAQGRPVPAIDHAVGAGDAARALALLDAHAADLLAQGRMRLLARWFDALPADALADHLPLQMVRIWAVCFTRGPWEAMAMLERVGPEGAARDDVAPHLRALKPTLLAMMDRHEEAYEVGLKSLEHLPSRVPFADNVLANAMATIASVIGDRPHAQRLVDAARRGQGANASAFNRMYSEVAEGIIDLEAARLRQAGARFRIAVSENPSGRYAPTHGNAWAGVVHALSVYEGGDLPQAKHLLQVYLPLARDVGLADPVIIGHVLLSRIAFCDGDVDLALHLLTELEYLGHKGRLPRLVAGAKLERARLLLLQGHHAAAKDELDRADDPVLWQQVDRLRHLANDIEHMALARLRWELHAGDAAAAAQRLDAAAHAARAAARLRRALKFDLLHAMALHRAGDVAAGLARLATVLRTTSAEGYCRLVLDEGERAGAMLQALARSFGHGDAARHDPLVVDHARRLAGHFGPLLDAPAPAQGSAAGAPLEPLTRKEIRVLQLLAEGYSNSAMAEKLFVSDSTVRTHLRNINGKLDAHSRTQAVALARRLGVIR